MLGFAQARELAEPRGIRYVQADAQTLAPFADQSFDGVLCYMSLMDIPHLASTLSSVARVVRPGGWLLFSVLHPCYNPPSSGEEQRAGGWVRLVSGYWDEGYWRSDTRAGPPNKVGAYHRTLSTYLNARTGAGLTLEKIAVPQFSDSYAALRPVWAEVPAVLVARCRTANTAQGQSA